MEVIVQKLTEGNEANFEIFYNLTVISIHEISLLIPTNGHILRVKVYFILC